MWNPFMTPVVKTHRKYAPSSLSRILKCMGSIGEGANDRNPSSNDAANEGQIGHDIFEECMKDGGSAERFIGHRRVPSDGEPFVMTIDRHFASSVDLALKAARDRVAPMPGTTGPVTVLLEHEVSLRGYEELCGGTADLFAIHPVMLTSGRPGFFVRGGDLKMGMLDVDAEANAQMLAYMVMFLDTHGLWDQVEFAELNIFQPRIFYGERIKSVTVSIADLVEFRNILVATIVAAETRTGDPVFTSGPHCRYCARLGMCPASAEMLRSMLTMIHMDPIEAPNLALGWFLDVRKVLDSFTKRAEAILKDRAMRGQDIGRPLVMTKKFRQWRDEAEARASLFTFAGNAAIRKALEGGAALSPEEEVRMRIEAGLTLLDPPTPAQVIERNKALREFVDKNAYTPEGDVVVGTVDDKRTRYTRPTVQEIWNATKDSP